MGSTGSAPSSLSCDPVKSSSEVLSNRKSLKFYFDDWGNRTKVLDPLDKATTFTYDTENLLTAVQDALAGVTGYDYDRQGNLTKVTDARNYATEYHYDTLGRLTLEKPPQADLGLSAYGWKYGYADGVDDTLTTVSKPDDVTGTTVNYIDVEYVYDDLARVTQVKADGSQYSSYGYDINSRLAYGAGPANGTAISGTDDLAYWLFGYDKDGRLTKEMVQGNVTGTTTTYSLGERGVLYDNAGRRTKVTFESANRTGYLNLDTCTTYTYDSDKHWLKQIARAGGGDAKEKADYEYDSSDGRLTTTTYGNGAYVTYQYWSSGQLSKISHYDDSATLIASQEYAYDKAGNVTKLTLDDDLGAGKTGDATIQYLYDDLHRLTREDCNPAQGSYRASYDYKYWYDAVGNRTKMVSNDGTFSYYYSPRNELTKRTDPGEYGDLDWFFEYDMRGNLTKTYDNDGFVYTEYYWDSQDRLTKLLYNNDNTEEAWQVQYRYDLMGRRVAKRVDSGSWRWYFYDGLQPIAEGTGTNDRTTYTLAPSAIGGIICRDDGSNKYWYHFDRLGNVVAVTDENGDVDTLYTMEAFGTVLEMTNGGDFSNERSTDVQPYHLTTKEWDADADLYYFNARWYDKNTGRFVSRTAFPVEQEHPYSLCTNNPVSAVDYNGLREKWPDKLPLPIKPWNLLKCVKVAKETNSRYVNDPANYGNGWKYLHCMVICKVTEECGFLVGIMGQLGYEIYTGPFGDDSRDHGCRDIKYGSTIWTLYAADTFGDMYAGIMGALKMGCPCEKYCEKFKKRGVLGIPGTCNRGKPWVPPGYHI